MVKILATPRERMKKTTKNSKDRTSVSTNDIVDSVRQRFAADYLRFQYQFAEFIAEHLSDVSREFKGDIQAVILLAIIGQVHLKAKMEAEPLGQSIEDIPPERRGITTNRLADATSIPRETTRRKLIKLEQLGWLTREENYWRLATGGHGVSARHALSEVDDRSITRAAKLFVSLSEIVENKTTLSDK